MVPGQFTELLCERQEELGGADQARVYASGSVGNDFYIAVVDNARTNETEVVIANQKEGDDTSAIYSAKVGRIGPRLANVALTISDEPRSSSLSPDDRVTLGNMAASNTDVAHLLVPERDHITWGFTSFVSDGRGTITPGHFRPRTDSTVSPSRFMGRPIKPFPKDLS